MGIKETMELLEALYDAVVKLREKLDDQKLSIIELISLAGNALKIAKELQIEEIRAEIADLDTEEVKELLSLIVEIGKEIAGIIKIFVKE
jgi:hypothetical protein